MKYRLSLATAPITVLFAVSALLTATATLAPSSANAQEAASCPCYPAVTNIKTECYELPPVVEQGQVNPGEPFRIDIEKASYYWRYVCPADPATQSSRAGDSFFELVIAKDLQANPPANSCHSYTYSDRDGDYHLYHDGLDSNTADVCWSVLQQTASEMGATPVQNEP